MSPAYSSDMFRKRLTIALAVLAAATVAHGGFALWSAQVAETQVIRGRIASDIQQGFLELSARKQRLRTWVVQMLLGANADIAQREILHAEMREILQRLNALSQQAVALDSSEATRYEHENRKSSLAVLDQSLGELERTVAAARPLDADADPREAWDTISKVFDVSQGHDLRTLVAQSIEREAVAKARERAAADASLRGMRTLWLGAAGTLAVAALLLGVYFARALRGPLDKLSAGASALQNGQFDHRIALDGTDEFAAVAHSMNAMAAELAEHRAREAEARHRLEELVQSRTAELQGALGALQEMDARRRQLLADISHELRTPTTAIRGEAEVTLRGQTHTVEDYRSTLQRIVDIARQLGRVIDDLLTMTRSDTDSLALKRQHMDVGVALAEAIDQARTIAAERNIHIQASLTGAELAVMGDALRLRQLFMLLLDNAIRYSRPGGTVEVEVRTPQEVLVTPFCEILVRDHGIGIPENELTRVFERHFRGEEARRHRADGSGLGLSIGLALARAHGGEVSMESSPEKGTTAIVRLPLLATSPSYSVIK